MSVLFPETIDPWRAARLGQCYAAGIEVRKFHRISEPGSLLEPVFVRIAFAAEARGRIRIDLELSAHMGWQCQRCLEPLQWTQQVARKLMLMEPEIGLPVAANSQAMGATVAAQDLDALRVAHGGTLNLIELIEDELLLALPFAPTHGDCKPLNIVSNTEFETVSKDNPFAELEHLQLRKPNI